MGESKEELNSIKTCDFQAIFIAESAETLQVRLLFFYWCWHFKLFSVDLT